MTPAQYQEIIAQFHSIEILLLCAIILIGVTTIILALAFKN